MSRTRLGISLLDILPQTSSLAMKVPDAIVEKIGVLTVLGHQSSSSAGYHLHSGTLQSVGEAFDIESAGKWPVRIPGLTDGLPFRLALPRREPAAAGEQEPAPVAWVLDIDVREIEIQLPKLRPAQQSGGSGVTPLTLKPKESANGTDAGPVKLVGRCVLRISKNGDAPVQMQLADVPDPLDPSASTGAVVRLDVQPPSFFFGDSRFGMTLRSFVLDQSDAFTPADILARGHDERWRGLQFKEATFFCPPDTPLLHNLSLGVRDVIVGTPSGLQGELRVEFGAEGVDVRRVKIQAFVGSGPWVDLQTTLDSPLATSLTCKLERTEPDSRVRVRAVFDLTGDPKLAGVWWKLPAGQEGTSLQTPDFAVHGHEPPLLYRLRRLTETTDAPVVRREGAGALPADQTEFIEVAVRFVRAGASPAVPTIDATIAAREYFNVTHVRGVGKEMQGIRFRTRDGKPVSWALRNGGALKSFDRSAEIAIPPLGSLPGNWDLTATTEAGTRRVVLEVVKEGVPVVGHQASADPNSPSVVTFPGKGAGSPFEVTQTWLAKEFHSENRHENGQLLAKLHGAEVEVPAGHVAQVGIALPQPDEPVPTVPGPKDQNVVQVLFALDEPRAHGVGARDVVFPFKVNGPVADARHLDKALPLAFGLDQRSRPNVEDGRPKDGAPALLGAWVRSLRDAVKFYVVGRTDDLWAGATKDGNDHQNDVLAQRRVDWVREALVDAGVDRQNIAERVERAAASGGAWPSEVERISEPGRLALPDGEVEPSAAGASPVWRRGWASFVPTSRTYHGLADDPVRFPYRCVEVLADLRSVSQATPEPSVKIQMIVPGPDGPPPDPPAGAVPADYRVRLRALWDSPTAVSPADAVPTLVEALVAWKAIEVKVPTDGPAGSELTIPKPKGPDFWEILLRWSYDARSGQTEVSGSLSLPDGALKVEEDWVAGALALGPALGALAQRATTDPTGRFFLAASMLVAGAVVGELLNDGSTGDTGSVDIDRFAVSYRWDGAAHASATLDYTVKLVVAVQAAGSRLTGSVTLRYKGVGLRFDGASGGLLDRLSLTYDELSVEAVDPGTWKMSGPLGQLIRTAAARIGSGSQWIEMDLEFALDLGVVRLEGATARVILSSPPSVELRGLAASLEIPETLTGRGAVTVGDAGAIRAMVDLNIIPAKLGAYGALAIDQDFVSIEVGVQLPVGLPLGATGLGIFGFMGRFVANGTRNVPQGADPVQRQLAWYERSPGEKYMRRSGQYAFGVGVVIGTLADGAFTFNAEGALSIGFPDLSVVLGVQAHMLTRRAGAAKAKGGTAQSGRLMGLVLIEPDSVLVALRVSFEIPQVVSVKMPLSAYFPLANAAPWYIRIGTDNHATRPGEPIRVVLLPSLLKIDAWAFFMIEERGLERLGGSLIPTDLATPLDFQGFTLGMGAGFDLKFQEGPFAVELSAYFVAGVGTKPRLLAGAAGIRGEVTLGLLSAAAEGRVEFHISDQAAYADAHVCARADLGLFSISGCANLHIGDVRPSNIPKPASPFSGVDLCDHMSAIKGSATRGASGQPPVVWPDTIAVLRCEHYVDDTLDVAGDFKRRLPPSAPLSSWFGSTELKYAYRLRSLMLWRLSGSNPANPAHWTQVAGPFDSAWWLPSHRKAVIGGEDGPLPGAEEGRELGLFNADPRAWSRWLDPVAGSTVPGDPAGTVGSVCEPNRWLNAACAAGADMGLTPGGWIAECNAVPNPGGPPSTRFALRAQLASGLEASTLAALGADAQWSWVPATVVALQGTEQAGGRTLSTGWRFPGWRVLGSAIATAPVALLTSQPLTDVTLVLQASSEPGAVSTTPKGACDPMPKVPGRLRQFVGTNTGFLYEGNDMSVVEDPANSGKFAVFVEQNSAFNGWRPSSAGLVDTVTVELRSNNFFCFVTLTALNDPVGLPIGTVTKRVRDRTRMTIDARGLRGLLLLATADVFISEVCWGAPAPGILDLITFTPVAQPTIKAVMEDGSSHVVAPVAFPKPNAQPPCTTYVYSLPGGPCKLIEVAPWLGGDLRLVSLCGVSSEVAAAAQADTAFRGTTVALLGEFGRLVANNEPLREVRLQAGSMYEVRAAWQWQHFVSQRPGDTPGPPDRGAWQEGGTDSFRFETAQYGLQAAPKPVEGTSLDIDPSQGGPGYDERTFDPRGLARYITRAAPSHEDPPHFLDDRIGFWFMVDHLQPLLKLFDRVLQVKVLRTRPEAATLVGSPPHVPGQTHVLDVTVSTHWTVEPLSWTAADFRFVEAARQAPCIGTAPALGSSSVAVTATLVPGSEYDLLLIVAPLTLNAAPEVVVARSHFRTSRYRDAKTLLAGLGFPGSGGMLFPHEVIVDAPLSAGPLEVGDAQMDAALSHLGLDPWPLSPEPRSTLLWIASGEPAAPWHLAGALLEADEPLWRRGMATGASGEVEPPLRMVLQNLQAWRVVAPANPGAPPRREQAGTLSERVRNAAGTRILWTPATPFALGEGQAHELTLQLLENGSVSMTGVAPLFDQPLSVLQDA